MTALLLPALLSGPAHAQTTTTYSYDSLQRVTGAARSDGSNLQYTYDANGNLTSLARTNPPALPQGQAIDLNLDAPGQQASFTFNASAGQSFTLNLNSISTTPSGSSITLSVYNSSGALVASAPATAGPALTLQNLAAGTYSLVVAPQIAATGALELTLAPLQASTTPDGDAPLPVWSYPVLGLVLLAAAIHQHRRAPFAS